MCRANPIHPLCESLPDLHALVTLPGKHTNDYNCGDSTHYVNNNAVMKCGTVQ